VREGLKKKCVNCTTDADMSIHVKELEKMLYNALKSKAELNVACERLQIRYNELLLRGVR
jgi:hypothetical protein